MPTENSPLLPTNGEGNGSATHTSLASRFVSFVKAEGQPSFYQSYKWFFFSSWFNILLVFVPLSVIAHHLNLDVAMRFSFSFLAIMPLAKVRRPIYPHPHTI